MQNRKIKYAEIAILSFVWIVLLVTPILFREDANNPVWNSINNQLEILVPISVLFLLNRFLLVPLFLFRRNPIAYIGSVIILIILLSLCLNYYDTQFNQGSFGKPPFENPGDPPPRPLPDQANQPGEPPRPTQRQPRPTPPFANFIVLSILVLGFDTGLRSGLRWMEAETEKIHLEKEQVATQLLLLRNQISPHFFMNTLNNIHALVDKNSSGAKEAIIKLSKMMRYLLYETEAEKTTLKKEVEFIESYINLMKLRYHEKVKINFNSPTFVPDKMLPPLLFISLIENAFKHGISYKEDSFVDIEMIIGDARLLLIIKNSKIGNPKIKENSGIGIVNTRKRMDLIFGSDYHLDIIDSNEIYTVNLSIPL